VPKKISSVAKGQASGAPGRARRGRLIHAGDGESKPASNARVFQEVRDAGGPPRQNGCLGYAAQRIALRYVLQRPDAQAAAAGTRLDCHQLLVPSNALLAQPCTQLVRAQHCLGCGPRRVGRQHWDAGCQGLLRGLVAQHALQTELLHQPHRLLHKAVAAVWLHLSHKMQVRTPGAARAALRESEGGAERPAWG